MKLVLLSTLFTLSVLTVKAQDITVLPSGKYETVIKNHGKWDKGDIVLMDDTRYKISTSEEIGEYRFSITSQRIFFTSGPLKGVYAKTTRSNNSPVILIPTSENKQLGLRLADHDIVGLLKN